MSSDACTSLSLLQILKGDVFFILRIKNIEIPSNLTKNLTLVCALGTFISSVLYQFSKVVFLGSLRLLHPLAFGIVDAPHSIGTTMILTGSV